MFKTLQKLYIFFFTLIFGFSARAYSFVNDSGVNSTAQTSGHLNQKLFGQQGSLEFGISTIITAVLSFLGVIFLGLIIFGGIYWMTARGVEQRIERAKDILTQATTGLVIVALAYAITYFFTATFAAKTLG